MMNQYLIRGSACHNVERAYRLFLQVLTKVLAIRRARAHVGVLVVFEEHATHRRVREHGVVCERNGCRSRRGLPAAKHLSSNSSARRQSALGKQYAISVSLLDTRLRVEQALLELLGRHFDWVE